MRSQLRPGGATGTDRTSRRQPTSHVRIQPHLATLAVAERDVGPIALHVVHGGVARLRATICWPAASRARPRSQVLSVCPYTQTLRPDQVDEDGGGGSDGHCRYTPRCSWPSAPPGRPGGSRPLHGGVLEDAGPDAGLDVRDRLRPRWTQRRPGPAGGRATVPAGPAPMMATSVLMAHRRHLLTTWSPTEQKVSRRCAQSPAPRPAGPRPGAADCRFLRSGTTTPSAASTPPSRCRAPAPPPKGPERHLVHRVPVAELRPAQLLAQPTGLRDRVGREPAQVRHSGIQLARSEGQQRLAAPVEYSGSRAPTRLTTGTEACPTTSRYSVSVPSAPRGARWPASRRSMGSATRCPAAPPEPAPAGRGAPSGGRRPRPGPARPGRTQGARLHELTGQPERQWSRLAGAAGHSSASSCDARSNAHPAARRCATPRWSRASRCPSGHPGRVSLSRRTWRAQRTALKKVVIESAA